MIELDGSAGEGGGQILRTSLALSLITGKPFHLRHIRARRSKPGLQPQHLMSVQAAAAIGHANLRGASLHSSDLVFEPGAVTPGNYHFRIGTAGATSLVLHTVYLPLAMASAPSTVTIEGGTHVKASPCFDFLDTTWRNYLHYMDVVVEIQLRRYGFYPRGGGLIEAKIQGACKPRGLTIEHVEPIDDAIVRSAVAGLPDSIARRQADRARRRLEDLGLSTKVMHETWQGGPGTMLGIELPTQPAPTFFFGLGERGKTAERVADEAVDQVIQFLRAKPLGIDSHSADQILLPLALARESSCYSVANVSQHLLTNMATVTQFVEREIICEAQLGKQGLITIK